MKCGDCKFLGDTILDNEEGQPTGYHSCDLLRHLGDKYDVRSSMTDSAGVVDGSGYFAALVVRDDFGCVKFEPKGYGPNDSYARDPTQHAPRPGHREST